jgi:hypothetical protein
MQDLFLFVGLASLLEVVPVHLVLAHWSASKVTGIAVSADQSAAFEHATRAAAA